MQELEGQILDDNPNALFKKEWIEYNRVSELPAPYHQVRTVIAIDPAITHSLKKSDTTGIIVVMEGGAPSSLISGEAVQCVDVPHYYVLADKSIIGTPFEWGSVATQTAYYYKCNSCIVEDNQGGDMTESTLINAGLPCPINRVHSSQNKEARAMQASILAQQGRLHFLTPKSNIDPLDILEDELTSWTPGDRKSPDRLDALAHAINFLNKDIQSETPEEKQAKKILYNLF